MSVFCWQSNRWPSMEPSVFVSCVLILPFISFRIAYGDISSAFTKCSILLSLSSTSYTVFFTYIITTWQIIYCLPVIFILCTRREMNFIHPAGAVPGSCSCGFFNVTVPVASFARLRTSSRLKEFVSWSSLSATLAVTYGFTCVAQDLCWLKPQTETVNLSMRQ